MLFGALPYEERLLFVVAFCGGGLVAIMFMMVVIAVFLNQDQ